LSLTSWRHLTGELRTEDLLSSALEQEAHEGGRGTPALQGRRSAFSPRGQGSIPVPRTGPGHGRLRPEPCRTAGRVRFRPAPGSGVPGGRAAAGGRGSGGGAGGGEVLCPALLVAVALDHVDLPRFAAGAVHPHLVLYRVAAGGVLLLEGGQARLLEAGRGGVHLGGGLDLHAQMVQAGVLAGLALDEDELERGLGDGEVGVAGAALGGF